MPVVFRRQTSVNCFFCQSPVNISLTDPRNFQCRHCGCWNRYDANGEIMSNEPAMHDETLNSRSFAKRASPSKDHLPTIYTKSQFCHTCQTNQTLIIHLMSSYLPPLQHPEYAQRLEQLPEYRNSLHSRYPPVCPNCLPNVEEEIKHKNQMARLQALGGWLKETKGKDKQRQLSSARRERLKLERRYMAWKIRCFLWVVTLLGTLGSYSAVIWNWSMPFYLQRLQPILPFVAIISLLWTSWDPTFYSIRKAYISGRDLRVKGKKTRNVLQIFVWLHRFITTILIAIPSYYPSLDYLHISDPTSTRLYMYCFTSLMIELSIFIVSLAVLRTHKPPPIKLLDTKSNQLSSSATPGLASDRTDVAALSEPELFSCLSLSSKTMVAPSEPIFGHPSLSSSSTEAPQTPGYMDDDHDDPNAMDWTPTNPSYSPAKHNKNRDDDGSWLRPQRFFAPEHPTGLETLFENTRLMDDAENSQR